MKGQTNANHPCTSPEFKIALIRTPFLPPRFASFYVPLSFNKLDMRDYLRNAYGVKILNVRSVVEQQKITRMRRDGSGIGPYRRPQSRKKMTVEMTEPFVWPDPPEDMSPYVSVPVPVTYVVFELREIDGFANNGFLSV